MTEMLMRMLVWMYNHATSSSSVVLHKQPLL